MTTKDITAKNSEGYKCPVGFTADPVIFTVKDNRLAVLLVPFHGSKEVFALPGGFIDSSESAEETALRKLQEKTGLDKVYLEQLYTYTDPKRDPRGWIPSTAFLSLLPSTDLEENANAEWHALDSLPELFFPDHKQMIEDALERMRGKLWYSNIAVGLLPEVFSMGDAKKIYEAIAGKKYDASNFSRDLRGSGLIEEAGERVSPDRGRPGKGYRFISIEPAWGKRYAIRTGDQA